jgi:GTP-binding protein
MPLSIGQVQFVGSFRDALPPSTLPEVAFAGRSNVGKSSALNCLLGRRGIARVSRTPGRTQLVNLYKVDDALMVADLPGYGYADVPDAVRAGWKPMIEQYLSNRDNLRLVVVLIDIRRDPQDLDGALLYGLAEARIPSLVVATKVDKLSKAERGRRIAALRAGFHLPPDQPIPFSATARIGRDVVLDAIAAKVLPEPEVSGGDDGR